MRTPTDPAEPAPVERAAAWRDVAGLQHAFFGRAGGCSTGDLASLNLSEHVGDAPAAVTANWRSAREAIARLAIVRMRQVHGARVVRVTSADQPVEDADAMLTDARGAGLAILTADCVPLLGVAAAFGVVMAVHAGWRGTRAGVAAAAIEAGRRWYGVPPSAWRVALGPSVAGCCYEVETEIGQQMVDRWGGMPDAWQPAGTHGLLDLRLVNRGILTASGVAAEQIELVGSCTSCASDRYFSHRRSGGRTGRQASVIGWSG
jgi:YfiH family protein